MSKTFRLLILDANIVIQLFEQGLWDAVVERCEIHLSETVIEEARFYEDDDGERVEIDLSGYVAGGSISVFHVASSEAAAFARRFDPSYVERLDAGELESLAYLYSHNEDWLICSADSIVYRTLGCLFRSEQGISLEKILNATGLTRPLAQQFRESFRERWTKRGFQDGLAKG